MPIVPAVLAVIHHQGKFLLTKRKSDEEADKYFDGYWQLPGGGVEFGENPLNALIREIKEELGIKIKNIRLLPEIFTDSRKRWQGIFICYSCEMVDPQAKIILNAEATEYQWFDLGTIRKLKSLPLTYKIALSAQSFLK